jgi:hypothetical protein
MLLLLLLLLLFSTVFTRARARALDDVSCARARARAYARPPAHPDIARPRLTVRAVARSNMGDAATNTVLDTGVRVLYFGTLQKLFEKLFFEIFENFKSAPKPRHAILRVHRNQDTRF